MKRIFYGLLFFLCLVFVAALFFQDYIYIFDQNFSQQSELNDNDKEEFSNQLKESSEMRACWFSYLEWQLLLKNKDEKQFVETVRGIFNNLRSCGINTLMLHLRAFGDAFYDSYDMSPILICDSIPYSPGTKIEFAGLKWTVISQNRMFADGSIGSNQLTKRTSQLGKCRSLTISETQCIPYIENWLIRHRKEPIYLLGNKKKIPIS